MKPDTNNLNAELLLKKADELMQKLNCDRLREINEEYCLQFEINAGKLAKIKSELQEKGNAKKKPAKSLFSAEGMHEAILEIVKAFEELKTYLK
jgi:hypothetical protein